MDPLDLHPSTAAPDETIARDLVEIDAAIRLVAAGVATRVRLASLSRPVDIAGRGLARAQAAGVAFALGRDESGAVSVTVGPHRPFDEGRERLSRP
jgi:hypothetical protein